MYATRPPGPLAVTRPAADPDQPGLFRALRLSSSTVLMTGFGVVDSAVAAQLSACIAQSLRGYRQLVLDLSRVESFGAAGCAVLQQVDSLCTHRGVDWILVPGPELERQLSLSDPGGLLPTAPNIVSAVATLARHHTARRLG